MLTSDADGTLWTYRGTGRGGFSTRTKVGGGWKTTNELVGAGGWNAHKEPLGPGGVTGDGRPGVAAHAAAPNDWGRPWLKVCPGTGDGNLRAPVRFTELRPSTYAF
ncbi:hypothetical protein ACH4OX_17605 [Streptomyces roseolus]|uniref:hypothetical protein n=1 Tax=Streptomyces roseolus TaxID=67358 RepID=UPI0037A29A63